MRNVFFRIALLCLGAGLIGCRDRGQTKIPAPPSPEPAGVENAVAHGGASTNAMVTMRARFPADPAARVTTDVPVSFDLRTCRGIQFDFWCDDLRPFSEFSCYFKSGEGWYHGTFSPDATGVWQRVTVRKSATRAENSPAGWGRISALRFAGWRAAVRDGTCAFANVTPWGGTPDVAVVYADSVIVKGGPGAKSFATFAGTVADTLGALGVNGVPVADTDLTDEMLASCSALVLPYNTSFPAEKLPVLRRFLASGRRMLACYVLPAELAEMMGIVQKGTYRPGGITGFQRVGDGLPGQPAFAPQASWITQRVALPPGKGTVLATWATGGAGARTCPALVRTAAGLYLAHVWLGGTEDASRELMRAMVGDLAPGLVPKMTAHAQARTAERAAAQAWLAAQKPVSGEHRAFWCHQPRGLGGGMTWEQTVRLLKENGFTAVLPNLAWGGVAFYASEVLPTAADVAVRGDALTACLDACRRHGVACHVWKICWHFGSATPPSFIDEMEKAGRLQVRFDGRTDRRWLCPSHPDNQALEIRAALELARRGVDGVHLDYIRYPDRQGCFCDGCRRRFARWSGLPVTNWPAAVRQDASARRAWQTFRCNTISDTVRRISETLRAAAPGVKRSAAVYQNPQTSPSGVGQDWVAWCRKGWLDAVCPMNYVDSPALFANQVAGQLADLAGTAVKLYPGIGLSTWQDGTDRAVRLARQIQAVRAAGLDGFTVFNLDRHAVQALPLLRLGVTREESAGTDRP